jgi:hypothetical protein
MFSALAITSCDVSPQPPTDVDFLASDAHFILGGQEFVLPFVAIAQVSEPLSYSNRAFGFPSADDSLEVRAADRASARRLAGDPTRPMRAGAISISFQTYQYFGEHAASVRICQRLTRTWSRAVCQGERPGALRDLPEKFQLFDRKNMSQLAQHFTVGKERRSAQVANMRILPGETELQCDADSKFCTAALAVHPSVVAIWTVWSRPEESALHMARRQGQAICSFARNNIGVPQALSRVEAAQSCA